MHEPIAKVGARLRSVLRGYCQCHALSPNLSVLSWFRSQVGRCWFPILSDRSQKRLTWANVP